jgi:hypothetical protein
MPAPTSTIVLTTAFVSINGVNLSAYVKSVKLTNAPDALEDTAMGATYHTKKPGLLNFSAEVTFYQRYDAALVNETIYPLVGSATLFPAVFQGVSAANTNNTFTLANAMVDGPWDAVAGAVGELVMANLKLGAGSGFTCTKS